MSIQTFELTNKNGMRATITNYGAAIINLIVPGKNGPVDVALGLDKAEDYQGKHPFFGVVVGRFANRIRNGKFSLNGKEYQLQTNDGAHHLHGGSASFARKTWKVEKVVTGEVYVDNVPQDNMLVLSYTAADGEGGYPGDCTVQCTYTLTANNTLRIDYAATTSTQTICNLTNHNYFNLEGYAAKNVYDHVLQIHADKTTAVDEGLIPTGDYAPVAGTPFDFNQPKPIGQDIDAAGAVNNTGGYDHNYVLRGEGTAAVVFSPATGVRMTVSSNSPGMQLYTGNFIDGTVSGKGATYQKHSGFCLETQFFPDSPNHPGFPSCVVTKEKPQAYYTAFAFDVV